ncbi:FeoB-associated Cys-rich membrane protein [Spirosoma soli]|uniref:FeoB-associated Cys-rich membrane protein n=1 Tax=Spirosoma soli TaxID=1770529 RepID=A0ABW5M4W9_9BACT
MQEFIIILVFVAAVGFLAVRAYRSFSKKQAGCGKGCGCATNTTVSVSNKR